MNPKCSDHFFSSKNHSSVHKWELKPPNGSCFITTTTAAQRLQSSLIALHIIFRKNARYKEISIATLCILLTFSYYPLVLCICLQYQMIRSCSLVMQILFVLLSGCQSPKKMIVPDRNMNAAGVMNSVLLASVRSAFSHLS